MPTPTPEALAQRQLDAYNARDLAAFLANYADDVTSYRVPGTTPVLVGKAQFGAFYATQRFNRDGLHAELLGRMVIGNKVIDHERIRGLAEQPVEVAVAYEVRDGLIRTVWVFGVDPEHPDIGGRQR